MDAYCSVKLLVYSSGCAENKSLSVCKSDLIIVLVTWEVISEARSWSWEGYEGIVG